MDGLSLTYHFLNCIILFPGGWVPRDTAYARAKARYLPHVEINSVLVVYACRRGIAAWIQGLWEKKGGRYGWSASWESTNKENMSYRGMNIDQLFWLIGLPWGIMSG